MTKIKKILNVWVFLFVMAALTVGKTTKTYPSFFGMSLKMNMEAVLALHLKYPITAVFS